MVDKITVELHEDEPTDTHFVIYDDGIVRTRLKVTDKTTKIRVILVVESPGVDINDKQCQAAVVTVAACQLRYGLSKPVCLGVRWDEVLRRG